MPSWDKKYLNLVKTIHAAIFRHFVTLLFLNMCHLYHRMYFQLVYFVCVRPCGMMLCHYREIHQTLKICLLKQSFNRVKWENVYQINIINACAMFTQYFYICVHSLSKIMHVYVHVLFPRSQQISLKFGSGYTCIFLFDFYVYLKFKFYIRFLKDSPSY
jgi:hypothetical protein